MEEPQHQVQAATQGGRASEGRCRQEPDWLSQGGRPVAARSGAGGRVWVTVSGCTVPRMGAERDLRLEAGGWGRTQALGVQPTGQLLTQGVSRPWEGPCLQD